MGGLLRPSSARNRQEHRRRETTPRPRSRLARRPLPFAHKGQPCAASVDKFGAALGGAVTRVLSCVGKPRPRSESRTTPAHLIGYQRRAKRVVAETVVAISTRVVAEISGASVVS